MSARHTCHCTLEAAGFNRRLLAKRWVVFKHPSPRAVISASARLFQMCEPHGPFFCGATRTGAFRLPEGFGTGNKQVNPPINFFGGSRPFPPPRGPVKHIALARISLSGVRTAAGIHTCFCKS
jgi:hypothetical protein